MRSEFDSRKGHQMKKILTLSLSLLFVGCATPQLEKVEVVKEPEKVEAEQVKSEPEIDVDLLVNCVYQKEQDLGMCFLPPYNEKIAERVVEKTMDKISKRCNSKEFMRTKLIHNDQFGHHLYFQCSLDEEIKVDETKL
jgi:hypothetical protein